LFSVSFSPVTDPASNLSKDVVVSGASISVVEIWLKRKRLATKKVGLNLIKFQISVVQTYAKFFKSGGFTLLGNFVNMTFCPTTRISFPAWLNFNVGQLVG
jgi:hypothetical protein